MSKDKFLESFKFHGVTFNKEIGGEAVADCPFCNKQNHFYVDHETGKWKCHSCGEAGNVITFLTTITNKRHEQCTTSLLKKLADKRRLPVEAFANWKIGWENGHYFLPYFSEKDKVHNIRKWSSGKNSFLTTGLETLLYGLHNLKNIEKIKTVWMCEGEWDCQALTYILAEAGEKHDCAVGVPGAATFKDDWIKCFNGKEVNFCYDNDTAGQSGTQRALEKISQVTSSTKAIAWPKKYKEGYDINDFIADKLANGLSASEILQQLKGLLHICDYKETSLPPVPPHEIPSFEETLEVYCSCLAMSKDMVEALKIMLAVVLSTAIVDDPVWVFIVSPPGGGKTALLNGLKTSPKVKYQSSISPRALVSGYKSDGKDPSMIPQLNGKCLVWKDFTEILAMHPDAQEAIFGTLRGAFDGCVSTDYGNGVSRKYNAHFSMLAGVTQAIHGKRHGAMGERFLRFQIRGDAEIDQTKQIEKAIANRTQQSDINARIQKITHAFLCQNVDIKNLPPISSSIMSQLAAFAQVIAILRTPVERNYYGDNINYKPLPESGCRLAKQLATLGQMLAVVQGEKEVGDNIYRLLVRVGLDSAIDFHSTVVTVIQQLQEAATAKTIAKHAQLPLTNTRRCLDDLELVGAIYRIRNEGQNLQNSKKKPDLWKLSSKLDDLWQRAAITTVRTFLKAKIKRSI